MMVTEDGRVLGTVELYEHELDATYDGDGVWSGPGADILAHAITWGTFRWPRRVERLRLQGVIVHAGDIDTLADILNRDAAGAQQYLNEFWPEEERQVRIPTSMPFRLALQPGARMQGRLLVEEGAIPGPTSGPFPGP